MVGDRWWVKAANPWSDDAGTVEGPMRRTRRPGSWTLAIVAAALVVGACSSIDLDPSVGAASGSAPVAMPPPTTTEPPNRAPEVVVVPAVVSAELGSSSQALVSVFDTDGTVVSLIGSEAPEGLNRTYHDGGLDGFDWTPTTAGSWEVELVATDDDGARATGTVVLEARHPANEGLLVAMGDSVASGHGLDRSDYLGRDDCWRDEGDAYPRRVFDALADGGLLGSSPELALVACSGSEIGDLSAERVGGGPDRVLGDGADDATQLEWAVRSNPAFVTLTVGANDLGFDEPWELITDGVLDQGLLAARADRIRAELAEVVDRLVEATDSTVVVTTYFDPSSSNPQGIDGCRGECFRSVVVGALAALNGAIGSATEPHRQSGRAVLVDLAPLFVGHGAPNGLGPDGLREGGWGPLGDLIGSVTKGTHTYCARGDTVDDAWISSVDCVHPTEEGAHRIAAAVVDAILASPATT